MGIGQDAPEFTHDRREAPIERYTDLARGLIREVYKDGHVEFKKIPKDED
jgi:hypothetical protein